MVPDAHEAGREAVSAACTQLPEGRADLCLVFGTTGYDQARLLSGVRAAAGNARVVGCSAEGVIAEGDSDEREHAVAVMVIQSDALTFDPILVRGYSKDPQGCAARLAVAARGLERPNPVALLVFPDGLRGNCTQLLRALDDQLQGLVPVVGGTSADAMAFERTYQYVGDEVVSDGVAAILISGAGTLEVAVSHGCLPIGLERELTHATGDWVYEIDGRTAWSVFKEYLDGDPEDLTAEGVTHLCVGQPLSSDLARDYDPYIIRTPMGLNQENGALFFPGGGLKSGERIRLTRRDPGRIRTSATKCARSILGRMEGRAPSLVLQFDCAGRGRVLFGSRTAEHIVHPLREQLGHAIPWLGFHTFGEIAAIGDKTHYHNYTVVLCALYDAA